MIPMPGAEVTVDELGKTPRPAELTRSNGPGAALAQGALRGFGDELLSRVEMPVETAMSQPGCLHELDDAQAVDAVAADQRRGDVQDAVMVSRLRRSRCTHDLISPPTDVPTP
jgi:hypothetical protein